MSVPAQSMPTVKEKEPELAQIVFENCIDSIDEFNSLLEGYKKASEEALKSQSEESKLKVACLKNALYQTICLIGDRLTWLRPGQFGRDFYKHSKPELFKIASSFED